MDSTKIHEMLPDFVRGLLNEEDSHTVQEGLKQSATLRKEYEELRSYYRALETLEQVNASSSFLSTVHTRIAAPLTLGTLIKKIFTPLQIKLPLELAGLAVTVAIVVLIYNPFSSRKIAPVVFDESAIQAKRVPVEIQHIEEAAPEKDIQPSVKEKERVSEQKEIKRKDIKKRAAPAVRTHKRPEKPSQVHAAQPEKVASGKSVGLMKSLPATGEPEEKAAKSAAIETVNETTEEMEPLALAKPAPSPAPKAGTMVIDDDEIYATKILKRSDSILMEAKTPKPAVDDVGLLALSISAEQSREIYKKEEETLKVNALRAQQQMSLDKEKDRKSSRKRKKKAESEIAAARAASPVHNVTFAVIERKITAHNGTFSLMHDKPQTPEKKYYFIEIPRKDFSNLKKALESEGKISDEKFSLEVSEAEKIQFNLIVSIE